ncbi:chorismate synthase [Helicobacter sp. WB40]|uniref:chorismate synthase n=1 Tax=Helicobacter sp. WB40 TaxID=3004130 RepID=UPI0022EC06A8|nr:chorismate synthase [Helicobacter sp. WB40]MDA3966601.1 chorismate synthase [Helicobacter sp. WB40]
MNTFGVRLRLSTFGESHGEAIGGILDGFPAGLKIDRKLLKQEITRRQGGRNLYSTQRKEDDIVEILSGVFDDTTLGTPIGFIIKNNNTKSNHYDNIKDIFRPGHADITYYNKYGIYDYRGGGRASARESAIRVAGGAFAKMLLREFNIQVQSGILSIGNIECKDIDFNNALKSEIYSLDKNIEELQKQEILKHKNNHDSIGGVALLKASNVPKGLGEGLYYKLDSAIGSILGLNGVKAVEIGSGVESSKKTGKENNDEIDTNGFLTNNAGGMLGGISNGEEIIIKLHFKPTPSIFIPQKSIDKNNKETICHIKGRHDPCIAIRGSVVGESMLSLILADMLLLNASSTIQSLKKIYA